MHCLEHFVHWYTQDIEGTKFILKGLILRRMTKMMLKRKVANRRTKINLTIINKIILIKIRKKIKI